MWKYSRYSSNPSFWGGPSDPDQNITLQPEGAQVEFEQYNLSDGPFETTNLATNTRSRNAAPDSVIKQRQAVMAQQRTKKRLRPIGHPGK